MKWQCFCQLFNVALSDDSDGSNGPCAPGYGLVWLIVKVIIRREEGLGKWLSCCKLCRDKGKGKDIARLSQYPDHVWHDDSFFERVEDGKTLNFLTIVDDSSCCITVVGAFSDWTSRHQDDGEDVPNLRSNNSIINKLKLPKNLNLEVGYRIWAYQQTYSDNDDYV